MTVNVKPLSANPRKWSNTLKQFVGKLPTNCLSVFDHFWGLALKDLTAIFNKFKKSPLLKHYLYFDLTFRKWNYFCLNGLIF